jgi:hypothetical protein
MKKILNNYYQDATYMTVDEFLKLDEPSTFVGNDLKSVQIYFNAEYPESSEIFEFCATFCQEPFQNSFGRLVKLYIQSQSDGSYKQHRSFSTVKFLADLVFTATGPCAGFAFRNFELILP